MTKMYEKIMKKVNGQKFVRENGAVAACEIESQRVACMACEWGECPMRGVA